MANYLRVIFYCPFRLFQLMILAPGMDDLELQTELDKLSLLVKMTFQK